MFTIKTSELDGRTSSETQKGKNHSTQNSINKAHWIDKYTRSHKHFLNYTIEQKKSNLGANV